MELREDLIEKVEDYLSGKLSKAEVIEQSGGSLSNDEFDEVVGLFEVSQSLVELEGLKEDLASIHQEFVAEKKTPVRPIKLWWSMAAAALIVAIAFFSGLFNNSTPEIEDYFVAYHNVISMRGGEASIDEAMRLYSLKNYQEAFSKFSDIQTDTLNDNVLFYQAISAMAIAKPKIAIENLLKLKNHDNNFFWQQTKWYLALAYWQNDQIDKAKAEFQTIKPGQFGYDKSRELIEDL